jgi:hypothetical protein
MPNGNDDHWRDFMLRVNARTCTPFIGAGACAGVLPTGRQIALEWADQSGYPFTDRHNLARVAQYVGIEHAADTPKLRLRKEFQGKRPDFSNPDEPHLVLARLKLPLYITTNYDDFMTQAILACNDGREPQRVCCQWHKARTTKREAKPPHLSPSEEKPVVYHLHGVLDDINSMVLTEEDYLNFLIYISEEKDLIPPCIDDAFTESSLLFMGYSLEDMNFKVLARQRDSYLRRNEGLRHASVQLDPVKAATTDEERIIAAKQRDHLVKLFTYRRVKVYWETCQDFAKRIRASMEAPE